LSEEIVGKLIHLLSYKMVDQAVLKRYDKTIADSQKKYQAGYLKVQNAVALSEVKINEKKVLSSIKTDERKLLSQQKTAQKSVQIEQRSNDTKMKLDQLASQFQQKLSQQQSQFDQKRADRSIQIESQMQRMKERLQQASQSRQFRRAEDFERRLERVLARRRKAEEKANKPQDLHGLGMVAGMGSMMFGNAIKKSASTFGDFEQAMIAVKAKTGGSDSDVEGLKKMALNLGRKTQFDPIEIANLMGEGAGQGYSIGDIKQMTPNALNLSTITKQAPAESMRLMSETLHQFGLQAKDSTKVADILGVSVGRLGVKAENFGYTMKYIGQGSRELGIGLKQAAALSVLQSRAGVTGSTSGTSIRAALLRSISNENTIGIFKRLKINTFNKNDNMDIFRVLSQLGDKTKGMKRGDRAGLFANMFGERAAFPMMGLARAASNGGAKNVLDKLTNLSSAKIAGDMFHGLNADIKMMNSSILTLDKVIGEKLAPSLEYLADKVRKGADWLSSMNSVSLQVVANLLMVGFAATSMTASFVGFQLLKGYLAPIGTAILSIGGYIKAGTLAMWNFNYAALATPAMILAIVGAIGFIGYEIYKTVTTGKSLFIDFSNWINKMFMNVFGINIPAMFDGLLTKMRSVKETAVTVWTGFLSWLQTAFTKSMSFISTLISKISFGSINLSPSINLPPGPPSSGIVVKNKNNINVNNYGSAANDNNTGHVVSKFLSGNTNNSVRNASVLTN
jgi:TP901 family phage tail tape measure protein